MIRAPVKIRTFFDIEIKGIGDRIKEARQKDDRSVAALAKEAGISRGYWYEVEQENIRQALPVETIVRMFEVLGLSLSDVPGLETITLVVISHSRKHKRVRAADGTLYNLKRVEDSDNA